MGSRPGGLVDDVEPFRRSSRVGSELDEVTTVESVGSVLFPTPCSTVESSPRESLMKKEKGYDEV